MTEEVFIAMLAGLITAEKRRDAYYSMMWLKARNGYQHKRMRHKRRVKRTKRRVWTK